MEIVLRTFRFEVQSYAARMDLAAEAVFSSDILYSTVHELSCAVLIERFQGHTSARLDKDFKVRGYDVVILDEVDALLVDSGVSTHYLIYFTRGSALGDDSRYDMGTSSPVQTKSESRREYVWILSSSTLTLVSLCVRTTLENLEH